MRVFAFLAVLIAALMPVRATEPAEYTEILRPVAAAYTLEVGSSHLCDTYLTPLKYSGVNTALSYERLQAMAFSPERWVMQLRGSLSLNCDENPSGNATMWNLGLDLSWGMMHRWEVASVPGLQLWAGGSATLGAGALYLSRNGNNPVAAKAALTVNATAAAVYNFKISRLPVTLRYQPELPVTGVFFSPDYGELYYEIYLGNRSGLVHGAWWSNYFRLDNLLTADLRLGSTNLRLGYRCDIRSSKANNIVSRSVTHAFVIGVSGEWLSLPRSGRVSPNAKIISAMY